MKLARPLACLGAITLLSCAGVSTAQPAVTECSIIAQFDAEQWQAYREGMRRELPGRAFSHYVDPVLAGAPSPWPRRRGETIWTRARLWWTAMGEAGASPLDCAPDFRSAGTMPDPGPAARVKALPATQEVVSYSRLRVAPGGRWALVSRRVCIPDPVNGPIDTGSTELLAMSGTRWVSVASSRSGPEIALFIGKGRPSLCTRDERLTGAR